MIDPTIVLLALLVVLASHARLRWRRGRRIDALRRTLVADPASDPTMDTFDSAEAGDFEPTAVYVSERAGSLIALDESRELIHLASLRGRHIESARLPIAQLESVVATENDAPLDAGDKSILVRSFRLSIALPDERRSLYDVELLDRPCLRDSATYAAVRCVAARCGELAALAATTSPTGERARPAVPAPIDLDTGRGWPKASRHAHAALASVLVAATVMLQLLPSGPGLHEAPPTTGRATSDGRASVAGRAPSADPVELRAARADALERPVRNVRLTQAQRARAFSAMLDRLEARLVKTDGRRTVVENALAELDAAQELPLDEVDAARVERLRRTMLDRHRLELPRYRAAFARDTRLGPLHVGAWAGGEANAVLELTRHDFAEAEAREPLWEALAEEAKALGFRRVEFRTFRGSEPLASVSLAAWPSAPTTGDD